MNEIIGPLYYVFTNDCDPDWSGNCCSDCGLNTNQPSSLEHSEADTFWCFTELMSEIRDLYNSQLDSDRSTGVVSMMTRLTNLLSQEDKELYFHLYNVQGWRLAFQSSSLQCHPFSYQTTLLRLPVDHAAAFARVSAA